MKKLKLNLSNVKGAEIITRDQLKKILGGGGSGSCTADSDCGPGEKCCSTTDGSAIKVCYLTGTGCPTSGVSGCSTSCYVQGVKIGCYWSVDSCRCLESGGGCS